ncbi:MAG: Rrf2 family transcriptional regulator [Oscillospiraceae bacterium]|nr:Rrf2 family transcriptional regulator [Oscillospiraceae bacterium]
MLISTRGRYALRVLVDMAEHQSAGYVPLKEIAERQEISEKYLESIVKSLVREGVLIGLRGKGGGYRLSKAPDQFVVRDILRLMEGTLAPVACMEQGSAPCPRAVDCRTRPLWQGLDTVIDEYLGRFTIEDLMNKGDAAYDYVI